MQFLSRHDLGVLVRPFFPKFQKTKQNKTLQVAKGVAGETGKRG